MKASADRWGFLSVAFSIILLVRENYAHASLRMFLSGRDRLAHIGAQHDRRRGATRLDR